MQLYSDLNTKNSSPSVYATCLLMPLVFLFVHPFASGYDTSVAISFITWACVGVCILVCSAAMARAPSIHQPAACVFVVMALMIGLRQGPLPASTLGAVITFVIMAVWVVCVSLLRQNKSHLNALLAALLVAALINALIALYQYFGWAATHPLPFIKPAEAGRALGQVNQRNLLAFLCWLGLSVIIYNDDWQKNRWLKWGLVVFGMVLTAAAGATASRSGALLLVAMCAMVYFSRRNISMFSQRMTLGFVFLYVGWSVFLPWLAGISSVYIRFAEAEGGCNSRLILWSNTATMIKAAPWFGHGWGSFLSTFYTSSFEQRFCEFPDHAHNLFLQLSAELGLPIAVAVGAYCLWLLVSQRHALTGSAPRKIGYSIVALSLIYSQTEFPLWSVDFLAVFSLALGLLFAPDALRHSAQAADATLANPTKARLVMAIFGGLVTAAGIVGHYQYSRVSQLDMQANMRDADLRIDPQSTLQKYWLFNNQLMYARIYNEQLTPNNAEKVLEEGLALLKYAPAPAVVVKIIESAKLLGNKDLEDFHTQRLKEIYPDRYDKWKKYQTSE